MTGPPPFYMVHARLRVTIIDRFHCMAIMSLTSLPGIWRIDWALANSSYIIEQLAIYIFPWFDQWEIRYIAWQPQDYEVKLPLPSGCALQFINP